MTIDEAKAFLQSRIDLIDKCYPQVEDYREALDLAIKALEQQHCEDCISRESIKQKLQEHHDFFVNAYGGFSNLPKNDKSRVDEITNCIAMVVNEPSVTPKYDLEEYSTKLWKLAYERGKTESEAEWKDIYAESEGSNSWIEFTCPHCGNAFGIESGQYDWSYGDAIPWKACPMCGGLAEHEPYKAESEEEE